MTSSRTDTAQRDNPTPGFAQVGSAYYPVLVAVFTALVIISNVTATKGVAFGPIIGNWSIITDGGFIVFPLTYVIGDVLGGLRVQAARKAIILGFTMKRAGRPGLLGDDLSSGRRLLHQRGTLRERRARLHPADRGRAGRVHRRPDHQRLDRRQDQGTHQGAAPVGPAGRVHLRRPTRRHPGVLQHRRRAIGITSFGDFATYTALGWVYKTAVEVVMLPITYRVIAYIKRHEPTYTALV